MDHCHSNSLSSKPLFNIHSVESEKFQEEKSALIALIFNESGKLEAKMKISLARHHCHTWNACWSMWKENYSSHIISSPEPSGSQGELIVYPWSGVCRRRPSSSSVHIFKRLLLRNRLANQSQILCGASLGRGNESLYKWSRSHDQDGRHAQKCSKPKKIFFSRTTGPIALKLGM